MVSVDLFSEGFDCPDVEFIQMARPTLSLAKYLQMVGRGLRKSEGKNTCVMIDNVGLYRMFGTLLERNTDLRLTGNGILAITGRNGKTRYIDLRNNIEYTSRPTSVWFGSVEMLKVGDKYYDRTKHPYKAGFSGKRHCIKDRGFYVDIFMNNDAEWRRLLKSIGKPNILHTACILANDDTSWYIVSSTLEDGTMNIKLRK